LSFFNGKPVLENLWTTFLTAVLNLDYRVKPTLKMKVKILKILMVMALISCSDNVSKQPATKDGFTAMENEIKNEFGEDAYFTNITVMYDEAIGNTLSLTVTKAPVSLKMEQWDFVKGDWEQNSAITVEVPEGTKAADFMFQLNEQINLSKLGELVEKSIKYLKTEKDIESLLKLAFIKFPKNGDMFETEYVVNLKQKNEGATFSFFYALDGELIKMD
jgi:hypothetical protein